MNVLSCKGNIILLYHQCKSFDNQPDFVRYNSWGVLRSQENANCIVWL